jgi:hypothetical protein
MDPRAGIDDLEKRKCLTLPGLELRSLSRPARSQSLYRLRYPGSMHMSNREQKSWSSITTRLDARNDCAGEDHQQFNGPIGWN